MTISVVESESPLHHLLSCIGSVIAIIVILITFINIIYHYHKIFHQIQDDQDQQDRTNYILFFIICIIALYICINYAFIRTNLLTRQSISNITKFQCSFGFFSLFSGTIVLQTFIYGLLIHRIRFAFQNSTYEYPKTVYSILNLSLIIVSIICLVMVYLPYNVIEYELAYFYRKTQVICGAHSGKAQSIYHDELYWVIGNVTFIIAQVFYDMVLLYMFTKRLYALEKKMVEQHLDEINRINSRASSNNSNNSQLSITHNASSSVAVTHTKCVELAAPPTIPENNPVSTRRLTVDQVMEEANACQHNYSAKRIRSLHELIKQHTILIFVIVMSSIIWLFLLIFVNSKFIAQIVWVIMINIVCIWLMFGSSEIYWKCTTKYCCCYVCYHCKQCNKKRDITARTCFFFLLKTNDAL